MALSYFVYVFLINVYLLIKEASVKYFILCSVISMGAFSAEVDLSLFEELSSQLKSKNYVGAKDESVLKLLPQVVEPTRKIQGSIEENETTMSNE